MTGVLTEKSKNNYKNKPFYRTASQEYYHNDLYQLKTVTGNSSSLYRTDDGVYQRNHSDHLGSAQTVTNHDGLIHERIEYTPYGELWIDWKNPNLPGDNTPFRFTGKELDQETGLYYYGARYLDPKTSRWLSSDPAMYQGDYLPSAPVDDEARKRNGNLPGQGGVYNYVNLHVYHYAANNPIRYVDPDGNENKPALEWMKKHLTGIRFGQGYKINLSDTNPERIFFKLGTEKLPSKILCNESVYAAYRNTGTEGLSYSRYEMHTWFKGGGQTTVNGVKVNKSLVLDITKGQQGDLVFMGEFGEMLGHVVLLDNIEIIDKNTVKLNTYGANSRNDGKVGPDEMIFKKNEQGKWINEERNNYQFRGYGQYSE